MKERPRGLEPLGGPDHGAEDGEDDNDDRKRDRNVEAALHQAVQRVLERLLLERVEMPALLGDGDQRVAVALLDVAVDQEPAAAVAAGLDRGSRLGVRGRQVEQDYLADAALPEDPWQLGRLAKPGKLQARGILRRRLGGKEPDRVDAERLLVGADGPSGRRSAPGPREARRS
jgi:hypothetical protein